MKKPNVLYHYTCRRWAEKIIKDGFLKLTPSNLVEPRKMWMERRDGVMTVVSDTDDVKPVVWMTDEYVSANRSELAPHLGMLSIGSPETDKTAIRIEIPWSDTYVWWMAWQKKNRMKKTMFRRFTSHGERYGGWYISEQEIPLSAVARIVDNYTGDVLWENPDMKK